MAPAETDISSQVLACLLVILGAAAADFFRASSSRSSLRRGRQGRQQAEEVTGGVDFSGCVTDPDTGFCCVDKVSEVTTLEKDPILEACVGGVLRFSFELPDGSWAETPAPLCPNAF